MSGGRLARHVHVPHENGRVHVYGPGDEIPDWAARKITNPAAWAQRPSPGEQEPADPGMPGGILPPGRDAAAETGLGPGAVTPAAQGRPAAGANKELWLAYAAVAGVEVPDGATKAQIIAAVDQADDEDPGGQ